MLHLPYWIVLPFVMNLRVPTYGKDPYTVLVPYREYRWTDERCTVQLSGGGGGCYNILARMTRLAQSLGNVSLRVVIQN